MSNIAIAQISSLKNKRIVLGITASYIYDVFNVLYVASILLQAGATIDLVLFPKVEKFLSSVVAHKSIRRKSFIEGNSFSLPDILRRSIKNNIDLLVIAPCNTDMITELAHNLASNSPAKRAITTRFPILIIPALNMKIVTTTAKKLNDLIEHGIYIAKPSNESGSKNLKNTKGVFEPLELLGHIRMILGKKGKLSGRKIVITAGGTQESIDPVRVITNRSSGKQGYALAQAAIDNGAQVILITTPTTLVSPIGAKILKVYNAQEMLDIVLTESVGADILFMAAAVADFRPKNMAVNKLKKRDGIPQIELEATPDILATIASQRFQKSRPRVVVGFAAESQNLLENATVKLKSKKADVIVANDITSPDSGFGTDSNRITLLYADGRNEPLPLMSKIEVAEIICERVAELL
jgi:phosphopantothenoylcysteine decarboxylase/phosphopantothenate--cysteine ligase